MSFAKSRKSKRISAAHGGAGGGAAADPQGEQLEGAAVVQATSTVEESIGVRKGDVLLVKYGKLPEPWPALATSDPKKQKVLFKWLPLKEKEPTFSRSKKLVKVARSLKELPGSAPNDAALGQDWDLGMKEAKSYLQMGIQERLPPSAKKPVSAQPRTKKKPSFEMVLEPVPVPSKEKAEDPSEKLAKILASPDKIDLLKSRRQSAEAKRAGTPREQDGKIEAGAMEKSRSGGRRREEDGESAALPAKKTRSRPPRKEQTVVNAAPAPSKGSKEEEKAGRSTSEASVDAGDSSALPLPPGPRLRPVAIGKSANVAQKAPAVRKERTTRARATATPTATAELKEPEPAAAPPPPPPPESAKKPRRGKPKEPVFSPLPASPELPSEARSSRRRGRAAAGGGDLETPSSEKTALALQENASPPNIFEIIESKSRAVSRSPAKSGQKKRKEEPALPAAAGGVNGAYSGDEDADGAEFPSLERLSSAGSSGGSRFRAEDYGRGKLCWVKYRKDPFWPALVTRVESKSRTFRYLFLPLAAAAGPGLKTFKMQLGSKGQFYSWGEGYSRFATACDRMDFVEALEAAEKIQRGELDPFDPSTFQPPADSQAGSSTRGSSKASPRRGKRARQQPESNEREEEDASEGKEEDESTSGNSDFSIQSDEEEEEAHASRPREFSARAKEFIARRQAENRDLIDFIRRSADCKKMLRGVVEHRIPCRRQEMFDELKDQMPAPTNFGPLVDEDQIQEVVELLSLWYQEFDDSKSLRDIFCYISCVWVPEAVKWMLMKKRGLAEEDAEEQLRAEGQSRYYDPEELAETRKEIQGSFSRASGMDQLLAAAAVVEQRDGGGAASAAEAF